MRAQRTHQPGVIVHVISKFIFDAFLLDAPGARDQALARMQDAVARTDWVLLAYALMSNHLHWALRVGLDAAERIFKSLDRGLAAWLNHQRGVDGPVFKARPKIIQVPDQRFGQLAAYIHNNPVRAGVVEHPEASTWTSHRAYLGLEAPPKGLEVDLGLRLAGFDPSPAGRLEFARMVGARSGDPRDPELSGDRLPELRTQLRRQECAPVGVLDGRIDHDGRLFTLPERDGLLPERSLCDLTLPEVLLEVERALDLDPGVLQSRGRLRAVTRGRALALIIWTRYCGQTQAVMARALGLSDAAASQLVGRQHAQLWPQARAIAASKRF